MVFEDKDHTLVVFGEKGAFAMHVNTLREGIEFASKLLPDCDASDEDILDMVVMAVLAAIGRSAGDIKIAMVASTDGVRELDADKMVERHKELSEKYGEAYATILSAAMAVPMGAGHELGGKGVSA